MAELKPCPFCGGAVEISLAWHEDSLWWFVTRGIGEKRCECRVFFESDDFAIWDDEDYKLKKRQDLINAWNRRAEDGK